jgi:hypothetical protein
MKVLQLKSCRMLKFRIVADNQTVTKSRYKLRIIIKFKLVQEDNEN